MDNRLFKEINSVIDGFACEGVVERFQKRYKATKITVVVTTLVLLLICGGILYLHFKGYNCTIPARILIVIDLLMIFLYLRWKYF